MKHTPFAFGVKTALIGVLSNKLAMDAGLKLDPLVKGVSPKTWGADKKRIMANLRAQFKANPAMLAADADVGEVGEVLDQLADMKDEIAPVVAQEDTLDPLVKGVSPKTWGADKKRIMANLRAQFKANPAMLAADADVGEVGEVLDQLADMKDEIAPVVAQEDTLDPDAVPDADGPALKPATDDDGEAVSRVKEILDGKVDPDILAAVLAALKPEVDTSEQDDPTLDAKPLMGADGKEVKGADGKPILIGKDGMAVFAKAKPAKDAKPALVPGKDGKPSMQGVITKPAMDAAIATASAKARQETIAQLRGVQEALKVVRPFCGEIEVAMDSAEDVYRFALDAQGVDLDGVHPSAFPAMVKLLKKPGEASGSGSGRAALMAQDSGSHDDRAKRFPGLAKSTLKHR